MAGSQKTMLAPPQREGVQAAATAPILVPQRVCRPTQCLHSPSPAPPPKSSKKPKTLATEDMFPHNWSPPPVEFLASRAPRVGRGTAAHRQVGTVRPQGLRRLVCRVPMDLEQKPQCSDPKGSQDPQEELFWDMAASSRQAASPVTGAHSTFSSGDSEPYVNSLDYLLREKRDQALEQAWEKRLVQDGPDLDFSALNEKDVPLAPEHRRLVERFSMSLQVMPSVHPGEAVFLSRHHPLPCVLDCSQLKPRNCLEGLFLSSPLAQQLCLLRSGLLSNLYLDKLTCPVPLLQWLFQLLTWPPETSSGAFGLLWDISVKGLSRQSDGGVHIWSPSLREVMEVFHSLGARNPALHPLEPSPHSRRMPKSEARPSQGEQQGPPLETALDISLSYIYKFLTLCALAPPGAQADGNLSDLIALLCRAGLDAGLRLLPKTDLQQLLLRLLENIREWPGKLQQLCLALSSVSDHHHNLLALVQLFLDVTSRSRQLRSQLSLVVIARMLDQEETLLLWQGKAQLSALSQLLSFMRPSSLGQYLSSETLPPCQGQQPKGSAELDHKVCYLCHSLLTLAGVVVSCQDMTADQRGELQLLCVQLDRHVSRHIRESPQAMHWTKLKDLAVQTYIRWQELLSRYQPQAQCFSP